jgi:hypothetical protein
LADLGNYIVHTGAARWSYSRFLGAHTFPRNRYLHIAVWGRVDRPPDIAVVVHKLPRTAEREFAMIPLGSHNESEMALLWQ